MTMTNDEIEKKLEEQLPLVQLPCPTLESLTQRIETRRRNRRIRSRLLSSAVAIVACSALGIFASRWIATPSDESTSIAIAYDNALEEQADRTLEQIEVLQRAVASLPMSPQPTSAMATDRDNAPFHVVATWQIPVVVKSTRPESKPLERLNVLEITKKVDPRTLSLDELIAIEKLLPDQQNAWNQL